MTKFTKRQKKRFDELHDSGKLPIAGCQLKKMATPRIILGVRTRDSIQRKSKRTERGYPLAKRQKNQQPQEVSGDIIEKNRKEEEILSLAGSRLVDWYQAVGRELPWRVGRDAYKIWISEIMLQQTRIEAVKPYFARFMEALPDMKALAEVEEERLLKLWEGLGYYSRARNLKKCAMTVMEQYAGVLPADYEALKKLPGIGPYTAGAIGSIAYGLPVPAVDGNVLRVLSRLLLSRDDIMQTATKKRMEQLLLTCMPQDKPGEFNEGIMELGETICIPNGRPLCESCPVREYCLAYEAGVQEELPVKAPKKARRQEERTVMILLYENPAAEIQVAIRKRPDTGLLAGLYELPSFPGTLSAEELKKALAAVGVDAAQITQTGQAKHIFSHVEWDMTGYLVVLNGMPASNVLEQEALLFVERKELKERYALPTAFKVFKKQIFQM